MKRILTSLLLMLLTLGAMAQQPSNDFVVTGTITNSLTGGQSFGVPVVIAEQMALPPFPPIILDTVYTNSSGQYLYTVVDGSTIGPNRTFSAIVTDCNGGTTTLSASNQQGTVDVVALDFNICLNTSPLCDAGFQVNPGIQGLIYFASNTYSGATVDAWDFGDGNTSNGAFTNHTYAQPGTYNVCHYRSFFEQGIYLCGDTVCQTVVVTIENPNNCNAAFNPVTVNNQFTINFQPVGGFQNNATHFWSFGDGTSSTEFSPVHSYNALGTYNVCHFINTVDQNGNACQDTVCQNITVGSDSLNCNAGFAVNTDPNDPNIVSLIPFVNNNNVPSFYDYSWDLGFGFPIHQDAIVSHFEPGTYTACLTITNLLTGCTDTQCQTFTVADIQCVDSYFLSELLPNTQYGYQFTPFYQTPTNGQTNYWSFGDGTTSQDIAPQHTYAQPGEYTVCNITVVNQNGATCVDTACVQLLVSNTPPVCDATFTYTTDGFGGVQLIANADQTYYNQLWTIANVPLIFQNNPNVHLGNGSFAVCLTVSGNGCQTSFCDTVISVNEELCDASFAYYVNPADENDYTFYPINFSGLTYQYFVNGQPYFTNFGEPLNIVFPGPGTYEVCAIAFDNVNCQNSYCNTIVVGDSVGFESNISGIVTYGDNPNQPVTDAFVILYELTNAGNNAITASVVDFAQVTNSTYSFTNLPNGNYIVSAQILPISPNNGAYLPTFSLEEGLWTNSIPVEAVGGNYTANINLISVNNPIGGPGQIGGGINNGDTLRVATGGGATIYLENFSGQIIEFDIADANGRFIMGNLPLGLYNLHANLPGFMPHSQLVNITTDNMVINDLQIDLVPMTVTSVTEDAVTLTTLYPNPTNGNTTLNIAATQASNVKVEVTNLLGQVVYTTTVEATKGNTTLSLPTQSLSKGIYTVVLQAEGNNAPQVTKLVKQ